jgi:2'-5' RNA ligase
MQFDSVAYVVLDIPASISSQVKSVREKYNDVIRLALPIEITVAGSSGVGPFQLNQQMDEVFSVLDRIAKETAPIDVSLGEVLRFPNTDIFVLTVADETPFHALHQQITNSTLQFTSSPFPYQPHCTLVVKVPDSDAELSELLQFRVGETCVLDTMSVYGIKPGLSGSGKPVVDLLHRTKLSGN